MSLECHDKLTVKPTHIYLAKPKSATPQFFSNSIYRRPRPVNNMLIFSVFINFFIYIFILSFHDDRGEPFCQTVYEYYVVITVNLIKFCLSRKPCANLKKSGQTGDKTDFKYIIGVINERNELEYFKVGSAEIN